MKKHFIGVALFIFIVGISSFVASLFVEIPKPEVFEIVQTVPRYESRTKCSKKYRKQKSEKISARIVQAVYNEKTERLSTEYLINRKDYSQRTWLQLHFFIKDTNETRYLTTERILVDANINHENSDFVSLFSSFDSLDKLTSHENLYVISEPELQVRKGELVYKQPKFDESKAIAVLSVKD